MRIDRALRDGEAESESGSTLAGLAAVEGIEYFLELARRDAGPVVGDGQDRGSARRLHANVDDGAFPRELDRVPHDVLDRAVQEVGIADYGRIAARMEANLALERLGLEA